MSNSNAYAKTHPKSCTSYFCFLCNSFFPSHRPVMFRDSGIKKKNSGPIYGLFYFYFQKNASECSWKSLFSVLQQERIIPNVSGIAFHLSLLPQNPVDSCTSCGLQIREPDRHNTTRATASGSETKC